MSENIKVPFHHLGVDAIYEFQADDDLNVVNRVIVLINRKRIELWDTNKQSNQELHGILSTLDTESRMALEGIKMIKKLQPKIDPVTMQNHSIRVEHSHGTLIFLFEYGNLVEIVEHINSQTITLSYNTGSGFLEVFARLNTVISYDNKYQKAVAKCRLTDISKLI